MKGSNNTQDKIKTENMFIDRLQDRSTWHGEL